MQCPCNHLTEDYIQIFYMTDKGDIPSIQRKMSLMGPKSMRKVESLSLIFTDFYAPVLTSHLNSTKISLQLSANITLFAVCCIYTGVNSNETYTNTRCFGCIIYIYIVQCGGHDRTLWHPCLYIPWCRHFIFDQNSEFSPRKKRANKLD
jgi:hypothetical protein